LFESGEKTILTLVHPFLIWLVIGDDD